MNLKDKRDLRLMREVLKSRGIIKKWYLHAATKFMLSRKFSDHDEEFLEDITEFFLYNLDNIEDIEREVNEKNSL